MKQLFEIFLFDIKMNIKSFMGGYMLIVPVTVLLILQSFLPTVENTSSTIAVVAEGAHAVDPEVIHALEGMADVKKYKSVEDMEQKLRGTGTVEGLYWDDTEKQFVSVLERSPKGNKVFSLTAQIIRQHYFRHNYPDAPRLTTFTSYVPDELAERTEISPVATMGGSIFLVFMIILAGFIIGLGIVIDKEEGTYRAIRVSPATKVDYFLGKSLQPLVILVVYTIIALLMLGLMKANILQVYCLVFVSYFTTLLFGLFLGALSKNESEAIGIGKLLSMIVMLAILGGTLLPDSWHFIVWWTPFYWIYDILEEVFTQTATWNAIAWKSAIIVGTTAFYFILLRKKIVKGLS